MGRAVPRMMDEVVGVIISGLEGRQGALCRCGLDV